MDNENNNPQPVAGNKSKSAIALAAVLVIIIVGAAIYFVVQSRARQVKQETDVPLEKKSGSSAPAVQTTEPDKQSLGILAQKTGIAEMTWQANTEPDLAGYKIYYGTSPRTGNCPPGGYLNNIDVKKTGTPAKPGYKFTNLENGKTYYLSITSYDTAGNESCFSPESSKNIPEN